MAKKKRKHFIKLNNKIKTIFNGKSFEDGILDLDISKLRDLYILLFTKEPIPKKDEIVKSLRRVWSEADFNIRKIVVEFLEQERIDSNKKEEIIKELVKDLNLTKEEFNLLVRELSKSSKISKEKILLKLDYIRLKEKVHTLEAALDVEFNSLNEMEFVHSFEFKLNKESFHKLLLVKSPSVNLQEYLKDGLDSAIKSLQSLKIELIKTKEKEIKSFLNQLNSNNYLSLEDTALSLKKAPVDIDNLEHTPIEFNLIYKILKENLPFDIELIEDKNSFEIKKSESITLFSKEISYNLKLSYQKELLYKLIWSSQEFPIVDDFTQLNSTTKAEFELSLKELLSKIQELVDGIELEQEKIEEFISGYIFDAIKNSSKLRIKSKTIRKILYHFREFIKPIKEKKKKEELLAKTIKDFKLLYPLARGLNRKITFNVGPTNSGKTYQAMKRLKEAETGYYLAPLRLLALEGYENLKASGINVSLITGEEEIIDEESTHISSTIEMLNSDVEVDVCVIDEIQMIGDKDRGWAWVNALIGAPAKEIILTGSSNALEVVEMVCEYLGEELEVIEFERKNPLLVLSKPTPLKKIEPNSAIVTFSRKEVLALKQKLSPKYSISVVYGNLSPEVRREEAKRFREGKSSILIATDAIAMGLNLPIKSIIFARDNKFDGLRRRELEPIEVIQIAGRAGRFGLHEEGFIGAFDEQTLKSIKTKLNQTPPPIKPPLQVMATLEHILLIGEILESQSLLEILEFFAKNMEFEGPFVAGNIESMIELAKIVDEYELDLKTKYIFASAPVSLQSPYLEMVFHKYLELFEKDKTIPFNTIKDLPKYAHTQEELLEKEDRVKEVSLYLWLSFKFPDRFTQTKEAIKSREKLNNFIEETLKRGEFKKLCRICKRELDFSYKFNICEKCFRKKRYR